jgi:hypothetical protein
MAITSSSKRTFKPSRVLESTWNSFRKGLNTLLRDSELSPEQAKQMQNLILAGKGIVTQRPGTASLYQATTNGKIRGLFPSKIASTNELLAVSDDGYLTKKNGSSFTVISGASWASGYKVRMTQLGDKVYIVQPQRPLTRYDGSTLLSYTTLLSPVSLHATNLSGVTGTFTYSWRVAAVTDVGRTLASDPVVLANLPENLDKTIVRISWTAPTGASGLAKGYEVYGRDQGSETRMTGLSPSSSSWDDDGSSIPSLISGLPDFNETAGPNAKYTITSVGKVVLANVGIKKSRVMWSGADMYAGKFGWTVGGGYVDLDDSDGTEITGIIPFRENAFIVFKEHSIYQIKLSYNGDLGIIEPSVTKVTDEVGCLSGDTVQSAINNYYFIGLRPGRGISLNSIGYERNIAADVLRTAEISAVIAPDLEAVNLARVEDMFAIVYGGVYWWFFPVGATSMRCYGYDLERLSLHGPHTFPDNPVIGAIWYDTDNMSHILYGDGDDGYVTEVNKSYTNDKGVNFQWSFMTKKEDFQLPFKVKTLLKAFVHLANVMGGSVNVQLLIEKDDGNISTIASFSLASPNEYAGFGSFMFGTKMFGSTDQASTSSTNTSEVRRVLDLSESNVINAQILITGTGVRAQIIETQLQAREQAGIPSNWNAT